MEADEGGGVELVALPRLTCRVDVAMCRFLLDVASLPSSSDAVGESAQPLLSNRIRREAMGAKAGAVSSLVRSASANIPWDHPTQKEYHGGG